MKHLYFLLTLLLIFSGCASLSKTQVDSVKKFADATIDYSAYPKTLITDYLDLQNELFLLKSPLITNPEKAVSSIYENRQSLLEIKKAAEQLNLSYKILKCYAENLEMLATTDYNRNIRLSANDLRLNLDTLIDKYNTTYNKNLPKLSNLVFKAFLYLGEKYVENKRAKAIKDYMGKGNEIVCEMSSVTKNFVENKVKDSWMFDMEEQVKSNHRALRKQIIKDTLNYSVNIATLRNLDKEIISYYNEIDYLNALTDMLAQSTDKLCKAHKSLSNSIKEKKKLVDILPEIKDFYYSVEDLKDIHRSYKSN